MHVYENREALALALATGVAAVLSGAIATRGEARLAVSGGSTPALFLDILSQAELDWERVTVTLVDERFVGEESPRSNAALVRRTLLKGRAASARFLPLAGDVEAGLPVARDTADHAVAMLGRLDAVILGMGNDGHTASFFPGGDNLAEALEVQGRRHVIAMTAPGAGEPRLTLALRPILEARFLALHIEGEEKRRTLEAALGEGAQADMPVRAVLTHAGERLQIFWAP
jgi:6-phosphogluconolactonase